MKMQSLTKIMVSRCNGQTNSRVSYKVAQGIVQIEILENSKHKKFDISVKNFYDKLSLH